MKLLPGEKVRFLNEAIEGVVTKILNNDRVEITDEYGFTHTAPAKYLVRVEFQMDERIHSVVPSTNEKKDSPVSHAPEKPATIISALDADETIYAAIILQDSESPLSSDIELKLVNNCNSAISFTVARRDDEVRIGVTAGVLKSKNEIVNVHPYGAVTTNCVVWKKWAERMSCAPWARAAAMVGASWRAERNSRSMNRAAGRNWAYRSRRWETLRPPAPPSSGWRTVTMSGALRRGRARRSGRGSAAKWSTRNSNKSTAPGGRFSAHDKAPGLGMVPTT